MKPLITLIVLLALCVTGCKTSPKQITNSNDYNKYLEYQENGMLQLARNDYEFWEKKLEKDPNQFPYLAKSAASQSLLFAETGHIESLKMAEIKLVQANEHTNYNTPSYLRALSRNYISQHRFKEALDLLNKAEINGEKLHSTQKMLFDVHMELGNADEAEAYLDEIENYKDFDFLIRLSKWSDHKGDLDNAILYLKKASEIVEASNNKSLMQWSYTNLADYYGHAGEIELSYKHYLKALELNPNDAYAKKGIAWIVYSYERNPDEALRILDSTSKYHTAPDYNLLKAEIAEFMGNDMLKQNFLQAYAAQISDGNYGDMYNAYNILLEVEEYKNYTKAANIALKEVVNRPTPQSYDLLAWTYHNHGSPEAALEIMENHVVNKTFEPESLYHMAEIYKANGKIAEAKELKKELIESAFELGPLMAKNIKAI